MHTLVFQHILYAHGPFFLDQYGSMALWSTQGMERSHYQARSIYFKNTRHGGGTIKSNALHEMFNWFYRSLSGRKRQKPRKETRLFSSVVKKVASRRRTDAWKSSSARESLRQWRSRRKRCGRRYVLID